MELASGWLGSIAAFVLAASLKGSVLVAAVLLAQKLATRWLSATGRYLLWLPVLLALLTPLGFRAELPFTVLAGTAGPYSSSASLVDRNAATATSAQRQAEASYAPASDGTLSGTTSGPAPVVVPEAEAPANSNSAQRASVLSFNTVLTILPWLWLLGVAAVLALLAAAQRRLAALIQRAAPAPQPLQSLLAGCLQQTQCKASVRVLQSGEVRVPMIAGLLRPVLLLPAAIEQQLGAAQLRHVFIHELMHLRRGDILVNWIVAVAQALHWFNPAVWYAFHCLRQDRELACDSATLQQLAPADRAGYGHTLLQLNDAMPARPVPAIALGMLESGSHLHRRIHMLVQHSRYRGLQSLLCGVLLLPLAAVAFSQPAAVPRPAPIAPMTPVEPVAALAPASPVAGTATATDSVEPAVPQAVQAPASVEPVAVPGVDATAPVSAPARPAEVVAPAAPLPAPVLAAEALDPGSSNSAVPTTVQLAQLDPAPAREAAPTAPAEAPRGNAPATEPALELATIQQLGADIALMKTDMIAFIEKWEAMANTCAARQGSFFGVLSASCQRIRTALRNGDILDFGYQCFVLNTLHAQQSQAYGQLQAQVAEQRELAAALNANAAELASFCSKETYTAQYPAFAGILADAENNRYTPPQQLTASSRLNPPWNGGQRWVDMVNSTSMISHPGAASFSFSTPDNSYSSGFSPSNPAGGNGMGGDMGGGMGGGSGGTGGGDTGGAAPAP